MNYGKEFDGRNFALGLQRFCFEIFEEITKRKKLFDGLSRIFIKGVIFTPLLLP